MQPVCSENFRYFPITSRSREKRYQGSPRFSVLQATESWAGPGSEATLTPLEVVQMVLVAVVSDDEWAGSQAVVVENL